MGHAIAAEGRLRHDLQPARFDGLSADLAEAVAAALDPHHGLFDGLQFLPFRSQEGEIGFGHETDGGLVLFVPGRGQHLLITIADVAFELLLDLLPEAPFPVQQKRSFTSSSFSGLSPAMFSPSRNQGPLGRLDLFQKIFQRRFAGGVL